MSDIEGLDLEHMAPLDADTIPNDNQAHHCFSCDQAFTGIYCNSCGQKNDNYRRSLFSLLVELGGTLTALEGRIWRTWGALLFKPGKVAREFADGARTKWSSPIRTYLAMSLILFGFLAWTQTHIFSVDVNVQPKAGVTKPKADLVAADLDFEFRTHMFERQSTIDARNAERDFDLIKRKLFNENGGLSFNIPIGEDEMEQVQEDIAKAQEEINKSEKVDVTFPEIEMDKDNNQMIINGKPVDSDALSSFALNFIQSPSLVTNGFRVWLPRLLFFMMPLTMFIGAIFIRGRGNAMLYDHIIHAAYIHSFGFFLILIGIILSKFIPGSLIAKTLCIIMLIYLPLSLRRMFKRGWIKTIWTSYGVGFIYSVILFIGLTLILAKSFQGSLTGQA